MDILITSSVTTFFLIWARIEKYVNYFKYLQFNYWDQVTNSLKVENKQIPEVSNIRSLRDVICLAISLWGVLAQMPL